jgi:acetyl esterase/lipase
MHGLTADPRGCGRLNDATSLEGVSMAGSATTFVYKRVAEHELNVAVHGAASAATPAAVILFLHGGALIIGSRAWIHPEQLDGYLGAGFAVVSIDYRLAPETKLPGIIDDLRDAWAWLRREGPHLFGADPDQIALVGHSAGGYLALMGGFCLEPRPKALVSLYGYGDLVDTWYSEPDAFYCQQPRVEKETAYGLVGRGIASEDPDARRARSRRSRTRVDHHPGRRPRLRPAHKRPAADWRVRLGDRVPHTSPRTLISFRRRSAPGRPQLDPRLDRDRLTCPGRSIQLQCED